MSSEILKALKEASVSIACCLDDPSEVTKKDLEHIQKQITILENNLNPFYVEELESMKNE
tara:strand:- start:310 stop:489 length:180 start_codon:yes stop_codon:yes gene_type:complete